MLLGIPRMRRTRTRWRRRHAGGAVAIALLVAGGVAPIEPAEAAPDVSIAIAKMIDANGDGFAGFSEERLDGVSFAVYLNGSTTAAKSPKF